MRPLALEFQAAFLKGDKTEMDKLADPRFKTDVSKEDMDQLLRQIHDYCGELTDPVYQSWNESTNNGEAKMTITFKMTGTKRDAKTTVTFFKSSGKYLPGSFSFNSIGKDKTQKADKKSMSI